MGLQFAILNGRLAQRVRGPGGLYNLGNALGLVSGLALHVAATLEVSTNAGLAHGASAVVDYFAGSTGAFAITIAMLIFFRSGERYYMAWANGSPPDARLNRLGDISSGFGALALGLGLFLLGQPLLAATAGLLHAIGKFGSALPAKTLDRLPFSPGVFRKSVVASRIPAIAVVLIQVEAAMMGNPSPPLAASACLLVCYLLWLKADVALFRS
jgi:cytochrome bd-type quinol oxidase subunit 2